MKKDISKHKNAANNYYREYTVSALCGKAKFQSVQGVPSRVQTNLLTNKWCTMSHVQEKVIPEALEGRDIIAAAPTGSGKTIAFLIPAWSILMDRQNDKKGTLTVVVITPTRELASQILDVAVLLGDGLDIKLGLLIGGTDRFTDNKLIKSGLDLCIGTPGRLLDHIQNTKAMNVEDLELLIIDEADQILTAGFRKEINAIVQLIPRRRQTLMFSATLTDEVRYLAGSALKENALHINIKHEAGTQCNIDQYYIYLPMEERLVFLVAFMRQHNNEKIIVFFSSCNSVKFHASLYQQIDLLTQDGETLTIIDIHGKKKQAARLKAFTEFANLKHGVLFCTNVASRGLDLPEVDWIVQLDPPGQVKDYIHRVGRTARGWNSKGNALLCLQTSEAGLLKRLEDSQVVVKRKKFNFSKYEKLQKQFIKLIQGNYNLLKLAKEAYKGYILAYNAHLLKDCYDLSDLDLTKVAQSFGLLTPLNVNLGAKQLTNRKKMKRLQVR